MIYGTGIAKLLAFLAVIGLIASFHTIIYAYGRQIYSLSRAGYYLPFMSITHGTHKVPHTALYAGTAMGFGIMLVVWFLRGADAGGALIGGTLLNMAVFGAMISYAMQGISFIRLRQNMPDIARPYRSPLGVPGAAVTVVIAFVTLYFQLRIRCIAPVSTAPRSGTRSACCISRSSAVIASSCRRRRSSR